MSVATTDFPESSQLLFDSEIVQLREWGTERAHQRPTRTLRYLLVTGGDCLVRRSAALCACRISGRLT